MLEYEPDFSETCENYQSKKSLIRYKNKTFYNFYIKVYLMSNVLECLPDHLRLDSSSLPAEHSHHDYCTDKSTKQLENIVSEQNKATATAVISHLRISNNGELKEM